MVCWGCVLKKGLAEESNRVLQELLRKANERYELLHEENERQKEHSKESNRVLEELLNEEKKRSKLLERSLERSK